MIGGAFILLGTGKVKDFIGAHLLDLSLMDDLSCL